jgi:hypothetical protein
MIVHGAPRRFIKIWRFEQLPSVLGSLDDLIDVLPREAETLKAMRADGVTLDSAGGTADDYAYLVTTDPEVAKKYDMHDESDFMDADEGNEPESQSP